MAKANHINEYQRDLPATTCDRYDFDFCSCIWVHHVPCQIAMAVIKLKTNVTRRDAASSTKLSSRILYRKRKITVTVIP